MFYCVGNWKMNKSPVEAAEYCRSLVSASRPDEQGRLVLLPSALSAFAVSDALNGSSIRWGGQNCYCDNKGAYTGENSPQVLNQMGARFCLVGHSERRQLFFESDELMAKKLRSLQSQSTSADGMIPILCVGETLDDRKWRRTQEVIGRQLRNGLAGVNPDKDVWIAYEPVWAIGTGEVATPDQVEEAHSFLREILLTSLGPHKGAMVPILYGGSVKMENAVSLKALKNVGGFLIGGASLDFSEFLKIYRA